MVLLSREHQNVNTKDEHTKRSGQAYPGFTLDALQRRPKSISRLYASAYVAEKDPQTGWSPAHMDGNTCTSRFTKSRVMPKSNTCRPNWSSHAQQRKRKERMGSTGVSAASSSLKAVSSNSRNKREESRGAKQQTYVKDVYGDDVAKQKRWGAQPRHGSYSRRLTVEAPLPFNLEPPPFLAPLSKMSVRLQLPLHDGDSAAPPCAQSCFNAQVRHRDLTHCARTVAHPRFETQHLSLFGLIAEVKNDSRERQQLSAWSCRNARAVVTCAYG